MQFLISAAALLLTASGVMASPAVRRQADLDTKVRVILRNQEAGIRDEKFFNSVPGNINSGLGGEPGVQYTTLEVDVGADVDPALRCAVSLDDEVLIFATRGENLDDTFSDATNGEWTFLEPTEVTIVRCDTGFVANNRNA